MLISKWNENTFSFFQGFKFQFDQPNPLSKELNQVEKLSSREFAWHELPYTSCLLEAYRGNRGHEEKTFESNDGIVLQI